MLFQEMGKLKRNLIMMSIILMTVGIVMLICPEKYMTMLVAVAGYILLIYSVVMGLEFLSGKKVLINYIYFSGALLIGILGLAVLFYRNDALKVLGLIFGIGLVVVGISEIFNTWRYYRRAELRGWWFLIVLALFLVAGGIAILANPWWDTLGKLMKAIGGMMLFSSAVGIIHVIMIWPFKNV